MVVHLLTAAVATLAADTTTFSGREGELQVHAPRRESADVTVDARLDEAVWQDAAVLTGFSQYEPSEGIPASQETEVLVFYTSEAIYFGLRAYDTNPEGIMAHRTDRDQSVTDDWFRIMLDTFQDERSAYTFFINPLGIQSDGIWLEELEPRGGPTGPKIDLNPDYIWQSDGRVTDEGWIAEIRIPYVSLRFPETPVQDWGLQFARGVTRNGLKSSWAPLTVNIQNVLSQSGELVGLEGLRPQRLMELAPVITGSRSGEVGPAGEFHRGSVNPDFGLDGSLGIAQNLILDATYNPDFSQVEADVDKIEVNERFALFFPEKRAFFLDGTEIFQTPQRLVHTRRIIDPIAGAKLTGQVGSYSVAYLGALDESPTSVFGLGHEAAFNLVRVRRNMGTGSSVGLLYTDRTLSGEEGYNRVLSTDLRLLFAERYTLQTQLTGSWTKPAGAGGPDPGMKPLLSLSLERSGRNFSAGFRVEDVHPEFRTRSGFIRRIGDTRLEGSLQLTEFGSAGALVERYALGLRTNNFFSHDAFWDAESPFEWDVELRPEIQFRGDKNITLALRNAFFTFQPEDYGGYRILDEGGEPAPFATPPALRNMLGAGLLPMLRITEDLQVSGQAWYREVPLFLEGSQGLEFQLSSSVSYRPTRGLALDLSHTFSRLWRTEDDSRYSTVNISRIRAQYHFTETIFARVIAQYDLESRDALRDPTTGRPVLIDGSPVGERDEGSFLTQHLLQYEPSPGTIFFVGFSRTMEGPTSYALSGMDPVSEGLFAKLSYLFRF